MASRNLPSLFSSDIIQNPFFNSLQKEIDRVFDRFREHEPASAEDLFGNGGLRVMPALDIAETDKTLEITAELPGVEEKDIEVTVTDGVLTLKGEKSSDREEKEKDFHLVERRYGSFRRSVPLGFNPAEKAVHATYADGVLKLKIDKPAEAVAQTRKIKITKG